MKVGDMFMRKYYIQVFVLEKQHLLYDLVV